MLQHKHNALRIWWRCRPANQTCSIHFDWLSDAINWRFADPNPIASKWTLAQARAWVCALDIGPLVHWHRSRDMWLALHASLDIRTTAAPPTPPDSPRACLVSWNANCYRAVGVTCAQGGQRCWEPVCARAREHTLTHTYTLMKITCAGPTWRTAWHKHTHSAPSARLEKWSVAVRYD